VLGLAGAVLLLAALFAPLAGSAQDAPTQEPIATEETGVETPVDESPVVEESPVAEETSVDEETPVVDETPVAGETPGAGPDSLQADPHTSSIYVVIRTCISTYPDDFQQLEANCKGNFSQVSVDVYGVGYNGEGFQQTSAGSNAYRGLPSGQYTIRAFTPKDAKNIKATASTFPVSEHVDVVKTITTLGIGEALVTVLDPKGVPTPVAAAQVLAPCSFMGAIDDAQYARVMAASALATKYATPINRESAHEILQRKRLRRFEE